MKKLDVLKNAVTSRAGRQLLVLQKNSPRLMFVTGVVGVVATVVLASRATLQVEGVLEDFEAEKIALDQIAKTSEVPEEEITKSKVALHVKSFAKIALLYSPAVGSGLASIALLTGAHVALTRRNAGLTAAYVAVDKAFRAYRERVVETYGEDVDRTLRYGMVKAEVYDDPEDSDKGRPVQVLAKKERSQYARFFDESNPNWDKNWTYNSHFIKCQEQWANDMLRARGHVLLNDVYDMLGIPRSKAGCVVGWVAGNDKGDDYISFGVFNDLYRGQLFVNGDERSILLDFNVDGVVYDLIETRR